MQGQAVRYTGFGPHWYVRTIHRRGTLSGSSTKAYTKRAALAWLAGQVMEYEQALRLVRVQFEGDGFATFCLATRDAEGEFTDVERTEFTLKVGDYLALPRASRPPGDGGGSCLASTLRASVTTRARDHHRRGSSCSSRRARSSRHRRAHGLNEARYVAGNPRVPLWSVLAASQRGT